MDKVIAMKLFTARTLAWFLVAAIFVPCATAQFQADRSPRSVRQQSVRQQSSTHRDGRYQRRSYRSYRNYRPVYPGVSRYYGGSPFRIASTYTVYPLGNVPFAFRAVPITPAVGPFVNVPPVNAQQFNAQQFNAQHVNAQQFNAQPVGPLFPDAENFARPGAAPQAVAGVPDLAEGGELNADPGFDGLNEVRRRVSVLKSSTPQGRERADRFISMGDRAFADQKLARANALYRDAIAKAPDYAAGHFRLAHAYVATRQYTLAQKSLMVALELSGSVKRGGFSLEDMYQGDQFIRDKHLETLLDASKREPNDGGLRFLLGFFLHYDNKPLQGREHFVAANKIAGVHQHYTRYFLPAKPVAEL